MKGDPPSGQNCKQCTWLFICVGKRSRVHAVFFIPTWPLKNGPWGWNTLLPRDKEPTQPMPGLLPCGGIAFPFTVSTSSSFVLLKPVHQWPSSTPPAFSFSDSMGVGEGSFCCGTEGCAWASCPPLTAGGTCWP